MGYKEGWEGEDGIQERSGYGAGRMRDEGDGQTGGSCPVSLVGGVIPTCPIPWTVPGHPLPLLL